MLAGLGGLALTFTQPRLLPHPALGRIGFLVIALTAVAQFAAPRLSWLSVEESLAGVAGLLIIGLGAQHAGVLSLLWLVAVASGVLARGGRVHWMGRNILLLALALPILREGALSAEYAALCAATIGLLLTSGRLTRELNLLLREARLQAESAETLLLAGDLAARMSDLGEREAADPPLQVVAPRASATQSSANALRELARMIGGEGLRMAVQPIVDVRTAAVHAYEALARFDGAGASAGPLQWFALADELGERRALEIACLRRALELFARRPPGTALSVNLSAPVLVEADTVSMILAAGAGREHELRGLIIEITEETLVHGGMDLAGAIAPLRRRGALLAVDDMGAGYSGLRQITSILPAYLKLDRSLISGIDADSERAALVAALVGYSRQVGCLLVAEGVEHEAELRAVRRLGVPLVQGFYLSRPGPPWPTLGAAASSTPSAPGAPGGEPRRAQTDAPELLQIV